MTDSQPQFAPTQIADASVHHGADRAGQQFGNYRLIRLLAEGGFADVYLGEHIHLGKQAAIKILRTQLGEPDLERFREEARIVARLRHPHIVSVLDFDVEETVPFFAMDYAPNGNLRQRHARNTVVAPAAILSYLQQIGDALAYAHDQKLIHRDIKPENMLVGHDQEILLSDFGIAIVERATQSRDLSQAAHEIVGTLLYMAPEQFQGRPTFASDQYSLGVVTYEWLCGACPFHGSIAELAAQHASAVPPSPRERNPDVSPLVEDVVFRALAKEPERRYPSILDFVHAFAAAIQQEPIHLHTEQEVADTPSDAQDIYFDPTVAVEEPRTTGQKPRPRISRRSALWGLASLTTIGLVSGAAAWAIQRYRSPAPKPRPKPTPTLTPTPTPIPLGTTLLTYYGHADVVNTASWSPDGTYIASGGNDAAVRVWYASNGEDARSPYTGHSDVVNAAAWSPDGKSMASASADKTVQVWLVSDTSGAQPYTYQGHSDAVNAAAWSPNGQSIASASADQTVQVWNAADGSNALTYQGHSGSVNAVAWSPDGTIIASGSDDKTVRLWHSADGSDINSYTGHGDSVTAVAWSPNGTYIASASADHTVQVWNASTLALVYTYQGHTDAVNAVAWSPDGTLIVSGSSDQTAQLWGASDGSNAYTYKGHSDVVKSVSWSPNGTTIASASADKTVQEWQGYEKL